MSELQVFESQEFGKIRALEIDGNPWFVGKDVAKKLGYSNSSKAVSVHVDEDDKKFEMIAHSQNGNMVKTQTALINESGLYSLVLSSKLPSAKRFKKWVTSEVLPAIRKHGAYLTDEKAYDVTHNPNALADLLLQAGEQLKQKELIIQEMTPKAVFADAVEASKSSVLVGELAKILKANGIDVGQKRLFAWLRANGYLMQKGESYNLPTQKSMDLGLMEIKKTTIVCSDGKVITNSTAKITGKGQVYFVNKFLKQTTVSEETESE